jgi:hypothetical protein
MAMKDLLVIYGIIYNMDYVKVKSNSDTWSDVKITYVKTNTGWQPVKLMYTKIDDTTWVPMIPGSAPTIFKVTPNSVPSINNLYPVTTILGSNFTQNIAVEIAYIPYGGTPIIKIINGSELTVIDKNKLTFITPKGNVSISGNICVFNTTKKSNILPYKFLPNYTLIKNKTTVAVNSGFYNGILTVSDRINGVRRIQLNYNGVGSFSIPTRINSGNIWPFRVTFPDGYSVTDQINIGK